MNITTQSLISNFFQFSELDKGTLTKFLKLYSPSEDLVPAWEKVREILPKEKQTLHFFWRLLEYIVMNWDMDGSPDIHKQYSQYLASEERAIHTKEQLILLHHTDEEIREIFSQDEYLKKSRIF